MICLLVFGAWSKLISEGTNTVNLKVLFDKEGEVPQETIALITGPSSQDRSCRADLARRQGCKVNGHKRRSDRFDTRCIDRICHARNAQPNRGGFTVPVYRDLQGK